MSESLLEGTELKRTEKHVCFVKNYPLDPFKAYLGVTYDEWALLLLIRA